MGTIMYIGITIVSLVFIIAMLWWDERVQPSPHTNYLRAHHSAITNTHRMLFYTLSHLSKYQIPINPSPLSSCPRADTYVYIYEGRGPTITIPWVSEFDSILGYLYGVTNVPFDEPIYSDVYSVGDDAVACECVLSIDTVPPTIIDISGMVVPGGFRGVTVQTPTRTYTLSVVAETPAPYPALTGPLLRWSQGDLGSCVGCALSTLIHHATGQIISPMAIYWHARGGSPWDTGITFEQAVEACTNKGVVDEYTYRYDVAKYPLKPPPGRPCPVRFEYVYDIPELKRYIDRGQPVALETVLSTLVTSRKTLWNGLISSWGPKSIGHVVVVVGYTERGLLVDLQWEPWWGMQGKGLLPYEYFERGLVAFRV